LGSSGSLAKTQKKKGMKAGGRQVKLKRRTKKGSLHIEESNTENAMTERLKAKGGSKQKEYTLGVGIIAVLCEVDSEVKVLEET